MISVVIPAFNEEKYISGCLTSLTKQTTKRKFEVIVVDNNSSDKTSEVASGFKNTLNLKIFYDKNQGRGSARHTGFKNASGNIILSTDADAKVPADWIENLATELEKDINIAAVNGGCKLVECSPVANILFNIIQPLCSNLYALFSGHFWLAGFNFAVRKEIYQKSGGFDPTLNAAEDVDLSVRVAKLGKIKYFPNLKIIFSGRRFKKGFVSGMMQYLKLIKPFFLHHKKALYLNNPR